MSHLPLLLAIFAQVLQAVAILHARGVVHYDLKCDNIFVDTSSTVNVRLPAAALRSVQARFGVADPNNGGWGRPSACGGYFLVEAPLACLGDFGEARVLGDPVDLYCQRNRGTEYIKSPEMLTIARAQRKELDMFDRRRHVGSSYPSDVWSLGCLFYELVTNRLLFQVDQQINK